MNIKILSTADWHLGHNRVNSLDTIKDIRTHIFPQLKNGVQLFLIVGDIFDGKISFNNTNAGAILGLFADIFKLCYECNIVLRIVRGTFSHDLHQIQVLDRLYTKMQLPFNFRLINSLMIEHIESLNLNMLYMPDNLPFSNKNEVLDNIKALLLANNLKMVDYVACHGEFDHTNFGFINSNAYTAQDFDMLCKYLVLCGHIHKPQKHKKIIYSGSINRYAHSEEEAKGFWLVQGSSASFVENTDATLFITVDYRNETLFNVLIEKYAELMKRFHSERQGFLRVLIADTHLKQALLNYHVAHYPHVKLTFKASPTKVIHSEYISNKLKEKNVEVLEIPSKKNIANIVCAHLKVTLGIEFDITVAESIING